MVTRAAIKRLFLARMIGDEFVPRFQLIVVEIKLRRLAGQEVAVVLDEQRFQLKPPTT